MKRRTFLAGLAATSAAPGASGRVPEMQSELIFPLDTLHNHASCVVEAPGGDLLACWYRGSGERTADDVKVLGARWSRKSGSWSAPFEMADTPGFPDCNPCMRVDRQQRLWLFWPVILANQWHTALLMSRRAERCGTSGSPPWNREKPVLFKPGDEFARMVAASVERDLPRVEALPAETRERARQYFQDRKAHAADPYFRRMGWMPRTHPLLLEDGRLIVPLYSDGFDFSLMAISDDEGESWHASTPLIGDGPVQPALVRKRDGTIAAFMRDNGGPPQRIQYSESRDRGETWSPVRDLEIPNPGSGVDVVGLRNGHWALVYNDTERGRHSLAVSLSEDEGRTWPWKRHLDRSEPGPDAGSYSYPSIIQARDGAIHVTYSFVAPGGMRAGQGRESIKHARFDEGWTRERSMP